MAGPARVERRGRLLGIALLAVAVDGSGDDAGSSERGSIVELHDRHVLDEFDEDVACLVSVLTFARFQRERDVLEVLREWREEKLA